MKIHARPGSCFMNIQAPHALQVGDHATRDTHDVCRSCTKVVVPRSRCGPHLVVLQQIRVDEDAQSPLQAKRRYAAFVFGNLFSALTAEFVAERLKIWQRHVILFSVCGLL